MIKDVLILIVLILVVSWCFSGVAATHPSNAERIAIMRDFLVVAARMDSLRQIARAQADSVLRVPPVVASDHRYHVEAGKLDEFGL